MASASLTDRQKREMEFYEEYSVRSEPSEINFDPISGEETRPWNSYWHFIGVVKQQFRPDARKLLDFGCGKGDYSVLFAKVGYEVSGFDVSPNNISIARRLAEKYDLAGRTNFSVGVAEKLDYPDESFDVVAGVDILHHVTVGPALAECARVLKPGGVAIFHEPTRVPVFDRLRESRLVRRLVPREASLDRHITHDERKLAPDELELVKAAGFDFSAVRFLLFSRLDRFVRRPNSKGPSFLEKMDARLFKIFPPLKAYGGVIVLVLRKQGP